MGEVNYYAIIPAEVRYAKIPPQAKLLYSELTALTNKNGFSWATNQYFADLYDMTEVSISRLLKTLEEKGFIKQEYDFTQDNKSRRKIYLREPYQNCLGSLNKNDKASLNKNVKHNNTSMNNTSEYKESKKVSKKESELLSYDQIIQTYFSDKEMQEIMTEFIKMRKLIKKPITNYGLKLTCEKLIKEFEPQQRVEVVKQSIMNNWQGIYPLKKDNEDLKNKAREAYIKDVERKTKSNFEKTNEMFEQAEILKKQLGIGGKNDGTASKHIDTHNQGLLPNFKDT